MFSWLERNIRKFQIFRDRLQMVKQNLADDTTGIYRLLYSLSYEQMSKARKGKSYIPSAVFYAFAAVLCVVGFFKLWRGLQILSVVAFCTCAVIAIKNITDFYKMRIDADKMASEAASELLEEVRKGDRSRYDELLRQAQFRGIGGI